MPPPILLAALPMLESRLSDSSRMLVGFHDFPSEYHNESFEYFLSNIFCSFQLLYRDVSFKGGRMLESRLSDSSRMLVLGA
jgi:hypothetical protein